MPILSGLVGKCSFAQFDGHTAGGYLVSRHNPRALPSECRKLARGASLQFRGNRFCQYPINCDACRSPLSVSRL